MYRLINGTIKFYCPSSILKYLLKSVHIPFTIVLQFGSALIECIHSKKTRVNLFKTDTVTSPD